MILVLNHPSKETAVPDAMDYTENGGRACAVRYRATCK
jgi:hypothetical protein